MTKNSYLKKCISCTKTESAAQVVFSFKKEQPFTAEEKRLLRMISSKYCDSEYEFY